MPNLYVTPNGHWTGSQAEAAKATRREGSKPGSWKAVAVPTEKSKLIDFLNHGWKAPEPEPVMASHPSPTPTRAKDGDRRWRVYVDKLFSFVVHAPDQDAAEERAIALFPERIRVQMDTAH